MIGDELEQEQALALCEFHADNRIPLAAFVALQTQWRMLSGMGGAVYMGLEYASIPVVLDSLRLPSRQRPAVIAALRVMERAALPILNARTGDGDGG